MLRRLLVLKRTRQHPDQGRLPCGVAGVKYRRVPAQGSDLRRLWMGRHGWPWRRSSGGAANFPPALRRLYGDPRAQADEAARVGGVTNKLTDV